MATSVNEIKEVVRDRIDFVDYVRKDGVDLTEAGSSYKGLSPFNQETNPSFFVYPDSKYYVDYSGGEKRSGDCYDYVMRRRDVVFHKALVELAGFTGLTVDLEIDDEHLQEQLAREQEYRNICMLLTQAAEYYHKALTPEIRQKWYIDHYGFSDEVIDDWKLGFADGGLYRYFLDDLGVAREIALKTGLFVLRPDDPASCLVAGRLDESLRGGLIVDYFGKGERLVFPHWVNGQVTFFGARTILPETKTNPKYKKLGTFSKRDRPFVSETIRSTILNADAARGARELVIPEGYADCISAVDAGIPAISPATTSFSEGELRELVRLTPRCEKVILVFDNEVGKEPGEVGSGEKGAAKTARKLFAAGRNVYIATLPRPADVGKVDLNSFMLDHTPEDLRAVLDEAMSYVEFMIDRIPKDTPREQLGKALTDVLSAASALDPMAQEGVVERVVKRFSVPKAAVRKMLKDAEPPEDKTSQKRPTPTDEELAAADNMHTFRGYVLEGEDCYYVPAKKEDQEDPDTYEDLSSFSLTVKERIHVDGDEILVVDAVTANRKTYRGLHLPVSAFNTSRSFRTALKYADLQWSGRDEHVQGVLQKLSLQEAGTLRGTKTMGYVMTDDGPRWVADKTVIGPFEPETGDPWRFHREDDVLAPQDHADVVYVPSKSPLERRVKYTWPNYSRVRSLAQAALPDILAINEPQVILPILGWFFAAAFRPRIMQVLKHFPILLVWGTRETGKTSTITGVFWPLSGVVGAEPFSATDTPFAQISLFSCTNSVPVFLDEYKPTDMRKDRVLQLHRNLRRIYSGEEENKGNPGLGTRSFKLQAPVVIAGEARPENDAALADRLVSTSPDANFLKENPSAKQAFKRLEQLKLHHLAVPYIQFALTRNLPDELTAAIAAADRVIDALPGGSAVGIRCRDNLRVVALGLRMFEQFAAEMGVTGLPAIELQDAFSSTVEDMMDGESGAKNALDHFLEVCSVMAHLGEQRGGLIEDRHYKVDGAKLYIHKETCFEMYLEHMRRTGQTPAVDSLKPLKRLVKENHERGGYVVERSVTVGMVDKRRPRCDVIDLVRAYGEAHLDVTGFPWTDHLTDASKKPPREETKISKGIYGAG